MDSANALAPSLDAEGVASDANRLKQGDTVASRFVVDQYLRADAFGMVWRAVDQKSGKQTEILVLAAQAVQDRGVTERLRAAVRAATQITHKNLVFNFGMGREGQRLYLVRELVEGQNLSEMLDQKASAHKSFSVKGALNLLAHLCAALEAAEKVGAHGTLRPSAVLISRSGRVKLADFGLQELRPYLESQAQQLSIWDRAALTAPSDLSALAVMLFMMLVGRPPQAGEAGLPEALLESPKGRCADLLARSLNPLHPQALQSVAGLKAEILALLAQEVAEEPEDAEAGAPTGEAQQAEPEQMEAQQAQAAQAQAAQLAALTHAEEGAQAQAAPAAVPATQEGAGDDAEAEAEEGEVFTSSTIDLPAQSEPRSPSKKDRFKASASFVIPELRKPGQSVEDDGLSRRWLVDRDGVDYGPYSRKELEEQLYNEEITLQTTVFDVESDQRGIFAEFAVFEQFLVTWSHEKAERERRRVEAQMAAAARRRLKIAFGLVLSIAMGLGGYFWYESSLPKPEKVYLSSLMTPINGLLLAIDLPEELPETDAEIRERREREAAQRALTARRSEMASRKREERMAAEGAMAALDVGGQGGGGRFNSAELDQKVAARQGAVIKCFEAELRRNPNLKSSTIKASVMPSGELIDVKLTAGGDRALTCVRAALRGVRVTPFAGTKQSFSQPYNFQ